MNDFQCPYDDIGCAYLDTSDMSKFIECCDCEHYNYRKLFEGSKEDKSDEEKAMEAHNRFMMGL